jgi:hypothetical protein
MFALDWISKTLTGLSLEQLEAERTFEAKCEALADEMRHIVGGLQVLMNDYDAQTFEANDLSVFLGNEGLWVVNHDSRANDLWSRYLFLSGSIHGFKGVAPNGSAEPIYLRAYADSFELRSSYDLPCVDISPDFLDCCREV